MTGDPHSGRRDRVPSPKQAQGGHITKSGQHHDQDEEEVLKGLRAIGYEQEFEGPISESSNFAISFLIIFIFSGGINSLAAGKYRLRGDTFGLGSILS